MADEFSLQRSSSSTEPKRPSIRRFLLFTAAAAVCAAGVLWYVARTSKKVGSHRVAGVEAQRSPQATAADSVDSAPAAPQTTPARFDLDAESIQARLREDAGYIASDRLEGRGVRTTGLDLAADYIAEKFADAGLKTDACRGDAFQTFRLSSRLGLGGTNELKLAGPDGPQRVPDASEKTLRVGKDFTPLSLSASGTFDLPLAFVGYGISAPEVGYDDYSQTDVTGKAVIMLRHEPRQDDPECVLAGTENSEHAYFVNKVRAAVQHGAAAVILCTDHHEIERLRAENEQAGNREGSGTDADALLQFQVRARIADRRIPVIHCRREVVDPVVSAALGRNLLELEREIDRRMAPMSAALAGWRVKGTVSVVQKGRQLKNVIALLPARGPRSRETIVVGAHYDHLGRGGWGSLAIGVDDEIHNGADDNASGTAVILEVARQLAARDDPLPRTVLFAAFSAEEMGLIGSHRYVRRPIVPLSDTIAMINLDMVGRLRKDRLTVYGVGTAVEFPGLVDRLGRAQGFRLTTRSSGYGPSDHASFYERGIPVLHFFTGFHSDYHRPSDDSHKLNYAGMQRISRLITRLVVELAEAEERPQKTNSGVALAELLDSPSAGADDKGEPRKAYLGVVGDGSRGEEAGFAIARVVEDGPADKHGFRSGDVIVRFANQPVPRPGELPKLISSRKPGDQVAVVVRRGAIDLELHVTLGSRR